MKGQKLFFTLAGSLLGTWGIQAQVLSEAAAPVNILLITADDLNCNSIGAYGCAVPHITPNIDRLAHEGIQFMHAHVAAGVSQPSRGALATGRYPHCSGIEGFYHTDKKNLPAIVPTLKEAGYYCGILGKLDHSSPTHDTPWDYKKDLDDLGMGRDAVIYRKEVTQLLNNAKAAHKPFYLMINSHDPHRPFYGTKGEKKMFKNLPAPIPSYIYTEDEVCVPGFLPDLPGVRKEITQYFNSVKRLDDTVGAILKALKDAGEEKNTIIMFLSDNGMSQPFSKTNCYYQSTRTPWIVYAPQFFPSPRVESEHFISGIDLFPTVADLAGLPTPKGVDGKSFKSVLKGEMQEGRTHVFTEFQSTSGRKAFPMRCVQNKKYAYIFSPWAIDSTRFQNESLGGGAFNEMKRYAAVDQEVAERVNMNLYRTLEEFYDIEKDPDAKVNLIHHPAYQQIIQEFRALMLEQMVKTEDPLEPALRDRGNIKQLRKTMKEIQDYVIKRHEANTKKVQPTR